jgi:hypothetical protein
VSVSAASGAEESPSVIAALRDAGLNRLACPEGRTPTGPGRTGNRDPFGDQ